MSYAYNAVFHQLATNRTFNINCIILAFDVPSVIAKITLVYAKKLAMIKSLMLKIPNMML